MKGKVYIALVLYIVQYSPKRSMYSTHVYCQRYLSTGRSAYPYYPPPPRFYLPSTAHIRVAILAEYLPYPKYE